MEVVEVEVEVEEASPLVELLPFTPRMATRGLVVTHTQTLISYAP
jgi:hypothetical protein